MAKIANGINASIKSFVRLLERDISVERVILFGSHAGGRWKRHSDIDVAVVSPNFEKNSRAANMAWLLGRARKIDRRIEPFPLATSEIDHVDSRTFVAEIMEKGLVLYRPAKQRPGTRQQSKRHS